MRFPPTNTSAMSFSASKRTISASFPSAIDPFLSYTLISLAGFSERSGKISSKSLGTRICYYTRGQWFGLCCIIVGLAVSVFMAWNGYIKTAGMIAMAVLAPNIISTIITPRINKQ